MNIVIVEDNEIDRTLLANLFSALDDVSVHQFHKAEDALDHIMSDEKPPVDVVLSDWNMPEMTGFELLEACRLLDPKMPFCMITSNNDLSLVKKAKIAGASEYISKPYDSKELVQKVRSMAAQTSH